MVGGSAGIGVAGREMRSVYRIVVFGALLVLSACAAEPWVTLAPNADSPDDLQQQLSLQQAVDVAPTIPGNRVTLLHNGSQTLPAMFAAVQGAQDSITLEYFIFDDVRFERTSLGDVLVERLRHGVTVAILYDSIGSASTSSAFLDRLRQAGAVLTAFNPVTSLRASPNDRDHRKIMVIDGRIAFVGGVNMDHVYENPAANGIPPSGDTDAAFWRDADIRIDGPAVAQLQRLFMGVWAEQHGAALPERDWYPAIPRQGPAVIRIIGSEPGEDRPLYYISLLTAIHAARNSIDLSTGYFVPTHQEREELERAAKRGVRVRLILPGESDTPSALAAGHAAYDDLLEAGVHIFEMHRAVLHSKVAVVDGAWTTIGSSNLDRRSVVFNNEVDAIIIDRDAAANVEAMLDSNQARSVPISLSAWRNRPIGERAHEWRSRLVEWLL
jgi:cardiolipin synthase